MTNIKCGIAKRIISRQPFIEISVDEFEQFKDAKAKLIDALAIEEKFDFLLQNYAEYERDLLSISAEHMLFFKIERKHLNQDNKLVNRRMTNTLMSGRLYVDHLQTDLTALFGRNSNDLKKVQEAIQNEKEGTFAYRVMDKIRDYALHRSFPLKYVACGWHWEGDPPTHVRHTITAILDVDRVAMDQRFDREVLTELQSFKGDVNLTQLLRQHMEAIGRIHLKVREVMAHSVAKWDAIFLDISQRAKDFFKADDMFSVVKLTEEKECLDEEFIIDDIVHFRVELAIQNIFCLQNISSHYVSGIIESEAPK